MFRQNAVLGLFGFLALICLSKSEDDPGILFTITGYSNAKLRVIPGEIDPLNTKSAAGLGFQDPDMLLRSCDADYEGKRIFLFDANSRTIIAGTHFDTAFNNSDMSFYYIHYGVSKDYSRIAYDWLADNFYWTDPVYKTIGIQPARANDSYNMMHSVIVSDNLDRPQGIAVDPLNRYLFWTDIGTPKIERSDLSGKSRELLVTRALYSPTAVVADITEERIYWTDFVRETIETVTYSGTERKMIRRLFGASLYDIAVYKDYLIATDIKYGLIWYVEKDPTAAVANSKSFGHFETSYGVAVYHKDIQPGGSDYCDGSACSDICVNDNSSPNGYTCVCRQGFVLDGDSFTCIEDTTKLHRNILLSNGTTVCSLDARALSHDVYDVECFYSHPNDSTTETVSDIVFLEYDALRRHIYYATSTSVYKLNLDQPHLQAEHMFSPTGNISGISYDWMDYILYVSDSVAGEIYTISVDTLNAIRVQHSLNSPTRVMVVPLERKFFWLSYTTEYTIESADIGGASTSVIVGDNVLVEPKDLAHDIRRERIFWIDGYRIRSCKYDGSDIRNFMSTPYMAYLLTVYKDYLVWLSHIDGISFKASEHMIQPIRINARSFADLGFVTDLMVIDEALQPRQKGPCNKVQSPCDQLCLSTKDGAVCHCEFGYRTTDNGRTCTSDPVKENFVLVSDWTHNRMYQIDLATEDVHAVATFQTVEPISLVYSPSKQKIVWSSVHRKEIMETNLSGGDETIIGSLKDASVERLTIDETSGNTFYTAVHMNSYSTLWLSYIGVMSPDGRHARIIDSLHFPGGIAIHAADGLLFYTERGAPFPYIGRANMDGSEDTYLITFTFAYADPKGLAIDYEARRLYWTDTISHSIYSALFDGSDVQVFIEDPGADMGDLHLDEHFIYYIGWNRAHITKVSKTNHNDVLTLAPNAEFGRLEALFVFSEYYVEPPINVDCQNNSGKRDCSTFCLPTTTGSVCACEIGYTLQQDGKTCDSGVDDCPGVGCQNGGTCEDGIDSFTCTCSSGYTGELCATEINECDSVSCLNGGTCKDEAGTFSCQCVAGFTGTFCEQNKNECDSVTCLNGGTCLDQVNSFSCQCAAGFTGTLCQQNIYDCIGVTCYNGGTCQDEIDSYTCKCLAGYTGQHCEQNVNDCSNIICQNGGSCQDGISSYTCKCVAGYQGLHCEENINECGGVVCQNGGTCRDEVNAFSCQCATGFTGTLCETNINDCTGITCQNGGTCQDRINSYTCDCQAGYSGLHCEKNIDDCADIICQNGGSCHDGINSYTCHCLNGYTGFHCEQNFNDCGDDTCQNGGTCEDGISTFTCQCANGFTGVVCEQNVDDCVGVTCQNGGTCEDGVDTYKCQCVLGYRGLLCEENINDCSGVTCQNGGTCKDGINTYTCQCLDGYRGLHCGEDINECTGVMCQNGGTCQDEINSFTCKCVNGFIGIHCEQNVNDCTGVTCDNGGTCQDGINSYSCQCMAGYTGDHCGQNINECAAVTCQNGGTCQDGINSYACLCINGYTGTFCENNVDDCANVNCQNGGTCQDGLNTYSCQCIAGFTGELCEQIVTTPTTTKSTTAATGETAASSDDSSVGPIIGGALGAVALIALGLAILGVVLWRRKRAHPRLERLISSNSLKDSMRDPKVSSNPDPESHKTKPSKDLRSSYAGSVASYKSSKSSVRSGHSHRPQAENEIAYVGMTNPVYDIYGEQNNPHYESIGSINSGWPNMYPSSHHSSRPPSIAESYAPSYAGSYAYSHPPSVAYSGGYASIRSSQLSEHSGRDRQNRGSGSKRQK